MTSKSGMKFGQTPEGKFRKPSNLQVTKTMSKSEPVSPGKLLKTPHQVSTKNVSEETIREEKSVNSHRTVDSVNSIADKVASDLSLGGEQEKKTLECGGVGPASAKVSDGISSLVKTSGGAKMSDRVDFVESGKSSMCRGSTSTDLSDESSCSSLSSSVNKPHKANDIRWEAIQAVRLKDGVLGLSHFRLLKRLGCGDIGSVYLSELSGTKCYFAMKVMDKSSLEKRKKLLRAQTEREILQSLDHPFLPTLYSHFETDKFTCLVMEFCPGGDLHTLRQRQPGKRFSEQAVKYEFFILLFLNNCRLYSFCLCL